MVETNTQKSLSVKDIHGPIIDLMSKFQGDNGVQWLLEFKRFLRKQDNWGRVEVTKEKDFPELIHIAIPNNHGLYTQCTLLCYYNLESFDFSKWDFHIIDTETFNIFRGALRGSFMKEYDISAIIQINEDSEIIDAFGLEEFPGGLASYQNQLRTWVMYFTC